MHFFVDSLPLVTQIIKGKQLYYKMWSSKSKILRVVDINIFFTAILITYIKGGNLCPNFLVEGVCNDEGYILLFFYRSYQVFWLMLLLYPGELYRLLGASSYRIKMFFAFTEHLPKLACNILELQRRYVFQIFFYKTVKTRVGQLKDLHILWYSVRPAALFCSNYIVTT